MTDHFLLIQKNEANIADDLILIQKNEATITGELLIFGKKIEKIKNFNISFSFYLLISKHKQQLIRGRH